MSEFSAAGSFVKYNVAEVGGPLVKLPSGLIASLDEGAIKTVLSEAIATYYARQVDTMRWDINKHIYDKILCKDVIPIAKDFVADYLLDRGFKHTQGGGGRLTALTYQQKARILEKQRKEYARSQLGPSDKKE